MNKRFGICVLPMLLLIFISEIVLGDDLIPPPWRGESRTTFQHWTFDDDDNPAFPEYIQNSYGDAWADISVSEPHGLGWDDDLLGRTNIWADLTNVILEVDNVSDPDGVKYIWVQVTYFWASGFYEVPFVNVPSGTFVDETTTKLENYGPGSWFISCEIWKIDPNPSHEVIEVLNETPEGWIVIDQIVVDTICLPGMPVIVDIELNGSGNVEITWESHSCCTYTVESAVGPSGYQGDSMTWTIEQSGIAGEPGTTTWEDTNSFSIECSKFYRIYTESIEVVPAPEGE